VDTGREKFKGKRVVALPAEKSSAKLAEAKENNEPFLTLKANCLVLITLFMLQAI
jgi:hypothetical protein